MLLCTLILLLLQLIESEGKCTPIQIDHQPCFPTGSETDTCVTQAKNGTGMDWFSMQAECAKNDGRLVWLRDDYKKGTLTSTSIKTSFSFVPLGLLVSVEGKHQSFWRNPRENSSYSCASKVNHNNECLPKPASQTQCDTAGCCWINNACIYPYRQNLTMYGGETIVGADSVSTTTRRCVGLKKNDKTSVWTLTSYDCFNDTNPNVGLVCEHKCGRTDWPDLTPLSIEDQPTTGLQAETTAPTTLASGTTSKRDLGGNGGSETTAPTTLAPGTTSKRDKGGNSANKLFSREVMVTLLIMQILQLQK